MKKLLQLTISAIFMVGFGLSTYAQNVGDQFNFEGINYEITSQGPNTVKLLGLVGAHDRPPGFPNLAIPATMQYGNQGYTVTAIGDGAFDAYGKAGTDKLTSVDIPITVTSIGSHAFAENELSEVTIPDGVTSIGHSTFRNNRLTEVTLPNSVTSIGGWAFRHNQLTEVTLPDGVNDIGIRAFSHNLLSEVTIPSSMINIREMSFVYNPIKKVTAKGSTIIPNIVIEYFDNYNYYIPDAFANRGDIDLIVPKGRTQAYKDAGWTGFKSITEDTEDIGIGDTFSADHITYEITSLAPYEVEAKDYAITGGSSVNIPPTVNYQGTDYDVTAIGNDAFWHSGLTSLTFADQSNVTRIGNFAFALNDIKEVTIPGNVTAIGNNAFRQSGLTGLTFADQSNVARIGNFAFALNDLKEVTIPGSVTAIGEKAFWVNDSPEKGLTRLTFIDQGNLEVIGEKAFMNNKLTEVTIPSSVTRMDPDAFQGNKLTSVTIPDGVTRLEEGVFKNNELTSVTIPDGVTSIGNSAFSQNKFITITIPANVERIDIWAFNGSGSNIHAVFVEATTPPSIEENTFRNRDQIDVLVPEGTRQAYLDNGWTGFRSITEGIQVSIDAPVQIDNLTSFTVNITFNENVTGFTKEDIHVGNATVVDGSFSKVNGSIYTIEMIPASCEGTITINVPKNVAEYAPKFLNLAASAMITVNALPMAPEVDSNTPVCSGQDAIFSITGGTPGDIVTYSEDSDGTVTNGTATIAADGTVAITVKGASSDTTLSLIGVTNGNCSAPLTGTATVAVHQDGPLTAIAQDITVEPDAGSRAGQVTISPEQVDKGSHGSCNNGPISLSLDRTVFTCDDVGTPTTVTLTATQGTKTATATAVVTIVDNMAPIVVVKDHTVGLDASGNASIQASDVHNGIWDNCGIGTVTVNPSRFDRTDLGANTVSLTVTDNNGNQHTAMAIVTVEAYSAQIHNVFTVSGMDYGITSMNPYTVTAMGLSGTNISGRLSVTPSSGAITIPETVSYEGTTYIVTGIGDGAFEGNTLTTVTIGQNVTSIGANAFANNPDLAIMEAKGTVPPALLQGTFKNADRDQIKLKVPIGKIDAYLAAGWTGFESISDGGPEKNSITIYPNPARDKVHIDLGPGQELKEVNIHTMAGAYLYSENGLEIDTDHLSKGMYLFEIVTRTGDRSIKKIVIADR
ncbi:hypothetical protein FGF1_02820 [Flavobacteriaceae bacterium GF1]